MSGDFAAPLPPPGGGDLSASYELQARRLQAVLEACQALSSTLVLEEVMSLICRGVDKAFGLTSVDIYEYLPATDELVAIWAFMPSNPQAGADFLGTRYKLDEHSLMRRSFAPHAVVSYYIDDAEFARLDPEIFASMVECGEKSIIEVGLLYGGEVLGLLSLGSVEAIIRLDENEQELLLSFAATAAAAIRNAQLYRTIELQATHDGLTGLFNHRFFYNRLEAEVIRGKRYGTPVGLLMLDVDDFKLFNDRYGHRNGDLVLKAVADVIVADVRTDLDIACRYGGEEFTVVLPNTPTAAANVAERLRKKIASLKVTGEGGEELGAVTVCIGVAVYPGRAADVAGLVRDADQAVYRAKTGGKDRVEIAAGSV